MKTRTLRVGGMSCPRCQTRIEEALRAEAGVERVEARYVSGTVTITYDSGQTSLDRVEDVIAGLGYEPRGEAGGPAQGAAPGQGGAAVPAVLRAAGLLAALFAAAALFNRFGVGLFAAFPQAEAGMSLGMVFVVGLLTSVHCVAMCGGINLSQTLAREPPGGPAPRRPAAGGRLAALVPGLLYNAGRAASYAAVGGLVGAIGSALTLSGPAKGLFQLAAGMVMLILGLNMLGVFPFLRRLAPRLPRFAGDALDRARRRAAGAGPLVVGLLNGLMPCGPLQAMQIYALSTGSALTGALSMAVFALGTTPLMFGLGAITSLLSGAGGGGGARVHAFTRRVMTAGACVIAVMGIVMTSQGWTLTGFSIPIPIPSPLTAASRPVLAAAVGGVTRGGGDAAGGTAVIRDGAQYVDSTLAPGRYPAITVQAGLPVRWTINAPAGSINGCNNTMMIPEYRLQHRFTPGDNLIEFTPERAGTFRYSCWMGMIRGTITVVASLADAALTTPAGAAGPDLDDPLAPTPAGYAIPSNSAALAEPAVYQGAAIQRVTIRLTDDGFEPAVAVVRAGVPAEWVIENESVEDGSAELRIPAYAAALPLRLQGVTTLRFQPGESFDFATADGVFFGYMKVAGDLDAVDLDALAREVDAVETLVYPDEFFAGAASSAAGCCGGGSAAAAAGCCGGGR